MKITKERKNGTTGMEHYKTKKSRHWESVCQKTMEIILYRYIMLGKCHKSLRETNEATVVAHEISL